jgi:FtsP/CotA-like multicopper oxidase with cupredoxin domain
MRLLLPLAALLLTAPASAQREPEWRTAREIDVLLTAWAYEPPLIELPAGQPVRLRFVNNSRATMAFAAPRFFRAARLKRSDLGIAERGGLRLAPGERRYVDLVAAPGRYFANSSNLAHRMLGMRAEIRVE